MARLTHSDVQSAGKVLKVQGLDGANVGIVSLSRTRRVLSMTSCARQWLGEFFGPSVRRPDRLPEPLDAWVAGRAIDGRDRPAILRVPLRAQRDGRYLTVRLFGEPSRFTLVLTERHPEFPTHGLAPFGLSRRETEVLLWITQGKRDAEIAVILGISPRTVNHHVQHILKKLGVETRTAAVGCVMQTLPYV